MSATVHLEHRGALALLTLDRPPANAMNHQLLRELCEVLPALAPPRVRGVVLRAAGRFFSAGLDLNEVFAYPAEQAAAFANTFDDAITGLFALAVPVVAAINGHATAGGAVLAATADFRLLAAGEAKVGLPEIQVGVPFPASALEAVRCSCAGPYLPELLYRGLLYSPAEALARNLVDAVVPAAELEARALTLAEELAGRPAVAFCSTKRALRREALLRMAAARVDASGQPQTNPSWTGWRTPDVLTAMEQYRQRALRGKQG